jgi:hypothetical protein
MAGYVIEYFFLSYYFLKNKKFIFKYCSDISDLKILYFCGFIVANELQIICWKDVGL